MLVISSSYCWMKKSSSFCQQMMWIVGCRSIHPRTRRTTCERDCDTMFQQQSATCSMGPHDFPSSSCAVLWSLLPGAAEARCLGVRKGLRQVDAHRSGHPMERQDPRVRRLRRNQPPRMLSGV